MGTLSAAVLAIDGGNSKTDVALVTSSGTVLAHVRGPGSSPHSLGIDGCADLIDGLVAKAAAQAGYQSAEGAAHHASVYLAGADLPAETQELTQAIAAKGWGRDLTVDNDTFALLRAGTDDRDAVAVVCGAGINCVGVSRDGRQARFPSLGRISGDWGGGVQLGDEALWWAARAVDGRGEPTSLVDIILGHFGAQSLEEVIEALHYGHLKRAELGRLAPAVLRAASEGEDPIAISILQRQAQEVVVLAVAALRRLDLLATPATVVLGGGVLTSGNDLLHAEIRRGLTGTAPLARPHITRSAPVVGAALLGLDRLNVGPETEERLRASFAGVMSEAGFGGSVEPAVH
ncbi:N-acetylglucosamine kinase [Arthrobacter subterraneus]|uniref:N-acetylglucosamine kinase n=1 Tax=Arthrobacter subterraneus TaxID=335973 RepID=UPI00381BC76E